jgi:endonuclease-3
MKMAVNSKRISLDSTAKFILNVNEILLKTFGKPKRNLKSDPLDILIATILSQNTNDFNSHKAFLNLKKKFPSYNEILSADLNSIEKEIRIAGLGKQKSKAIKNFLKNLKNDRYELDLKFLKTYDVEDALNYLTSFKGVGLKTAACVLLFGLQKNICPVDTHVHRTLNRIGIVSTKNREKTFWEIHAHLPDEIAHQFHTNLIKLGRTICLSQNPKCFVCPLKNLCKYENKNLEKSFGKELVDNEKKNFMLLDSV